MLLPALLFAAGLGMSLHYGHAWWQLPSYTPEEIEQSVDLNMALDSQHKGLAEASVLLAQQAVVRREVLEEISKERRDVQSYFLAGVVLTFMGLANLWFLRRYSAR